MSAIGALLDHLVRERAVNDLENEGTRGLEIREIEVLALFVFYLASTPQELADCDSQGSSYADKRRCFVVCISICHVTNCLPRCISSLQIFENESHACAQSDKTKEGLSLFGE